MEPLIPLLLKNLYFLVAMVGLTSAVGDALINVYARTGAFYWFVLGSIGWVTAAGFLSQILKQQLFGPSVALFFIGNICIATLIGKFYFKDDVSFIQWFGVALGVVALITIVTGGK